MIPLHRLTHPETPFFVNPDLIVTVESTPDTVVTLTSAAKLLVIEKPHQISGLIREWRASLITRALQAREEEARDVAEVLPIAGSRASAPGQ